MSAPENSSVLAGLSTTVTAKLGLSFPPERWNDLARALQPAAEEAGFATLEAYAAWLTQAKLTPSQLEALAARLTIGETYFFREPQAFEALSDRVLPELAATRSPAAGPLRIWSAGCCTGEEPYSLVIFLDRLGAPWRDGIRILATDINPHFLRKARAGVYRSWSFRGAPEWLQRDYFAACEGDCFELRPDIRRRVEFEPLNLALDAFPSLHNRTNGLDLIFCRNVLMYFSPAQVERVLAGFQRALVDGGHLVVGVCESALLAGMGFEARAFPGVTVYRKGRPRPTVRAETPPVAAPQPLGNDVPLPDPGRPFEPIAIAPARVPEPPADAAGSRARVLAEAEAAYRDGQYADAARRLESFLAAAPFDVDAATLLARAEANQGNLAAARRWIERALQADKLRAPLHYLRAGVLQELGQPELAAEALEKALYLEPDFAVAHLALADLAERAGRGEKARRHLAHALHALRRLAPGDVVPESDGLTAGRLVAMVEAMQAAEVAT